MQKYFNIFFLLVLVALGVLIFMVYRSVRKLEVLIAAIPPAPVNPPAPERTSINGGDFWRELKDSAENLTIQMQLK